MKALLLSDEQKEKISRFAQREKEYHPAIFLARGIDRNAFSRQGCSRRLISGPGPVPCVNRIVSKR